MIKLERVRTKDAIHKNFRGAEPQKRLMKLIKEFQSQLKSGKTPKLKIKSKWKETKPQLTAESHGKCAYCETSFVAVAFGDVEHYRPKSVYWWLAYVYDNYLVSCAICNQSFKGNKFIRKGQILPAPEINKTMDEDTLKDVAKSAIPDPLDLDQVELFEKAHRKEEPLIPNPYIEKPEKIFQWEAIEDIEEVLVTPNPDFKNSDEILAACEEIYGINRPQLKRRRFIIYETYQSFKLALKDLPESAPSHPKIKEFVEEMSKPESEYSAMIRYFESN